MKRFPTVVICLGALLAACTDHDLALTKGDAAGQDTGTIAQSGDAGDSALESPPVDTSGAITFQVDGKTLELSAHSSCTGGHRIIEATDGTIAFFFSIFVQRAGNYSCDDPLPYIFLQYRGPTQGDASADTGPADGASANIFLPPGAGPAYAFSASGGGGGQCMINVSELQPRFKGAFSATLDLAVGQGPPTVTIESGQIDVGTLAMDCL